MKDTAQINKYPNLEGFTLDNKISDYELNQFKKFINEQWYKRINQINPETASEISKKDIKIDNYHKISHTLKHEEIWSKSNRILPFDFVNWFKTSEFSRSLESKYGEFTDSDEDKLGRPNIKCKLVKLRD